jgi:DNA-binding HxlR family transcriptional regulator
MIKFRSNCPLTRALDMIGDKWTLLVLREIVAFQKTTFKEISQMSEGIATNILSDRLTKLVEEGFITKEKSKKNKLIFHYLPTAKAIDLLPSVMLVREWSEKYLYQENETPTPTGLFLNKQEEPAPPDDK